MTEYRDCDGCYRDPVPMETLSLFPYDCMMLCDDCMKIVDPNGTDYKRGVDSWDVVPKEYAHLRTSD